MNKTVLEVLSEKHDDWRYMALSFGVRKEDAEELVSGMYLKLHDYVKDVNKIMYSEKEVNTFYVYKTMENLYKSGYHMTGKKGGTPKNNLIVVPDDYFYDGSLDISQSSSVHDFEIEEDELYDEIQDSLMFKSEKDIENLESRLLQEGIFDAAFGDIVVDVRNMIEQWRWYDKKMIKLHFANLFNEEEDGMSMRQIAKETNISLKSVFLTLKACKLRIREELQPDYDKWKKSKYE